MRCIVISPIIPLLLLSLSFVSTENQPQNLELGRYCHAANDGLTFYDETKTLYCFQISPYFVTHGNENENWYDKFMRKPKFGRIYTGLLVRFFIKRGYPTAQVGRYKMFDMASRSIKDTRKNFKKVNNGLIVLGSTLHKVTYVKEFVLESESIFDSDENFTSEGCPSYAYKIDQICMFLQNFTDKMDCGPSSSPASIFHSSQIKKLLFFTKKSTLGAVMKIIPSLEYPFNSILDNFVVLRENRSDTKPDLSYAIVDPVMMAYYINSNRKPRYTVCLYTPITTMAATELNDTTTSLIPKTVFTMTPELNATTTTLKSKTSAPSEYYTLRINFSNPTSETTTVSELLSTLVGTNISSSSSTPIRQITANSSSAFSPLNNSTLIMTAISRYINSSTTTNSNVLKNIIPVFEQPGVGGDDRIINAQPVETTPIEMTPMIKISNGSIELRKLPFFTLTIVNAVVASMFAAIISSSIAICIYKSCPEKVNDAKNHEGQQLIGNELY